MTEQQVREVAEAGGLVRTDETISLIEYVAYLAGEAMARRVCLSVNSGGLRSRSL